MPFIYCYWELKTVAPLSQPFCYRVVSDGCIDILFELATPQQSFITGFSREYVAFELPQAFHYVGIRFLPSMFPQMYGVSAAELTNRFEALVDVAPVTSAFIADHFSGQEDGPQLKAFFDAHFLSLLPRRALNTDARFYGALSMLMEGQGNLKLGTDLDLGISQRQLRRLFQFYIGDNLKTFQKVVRFQALIRAKPSLQSLRENRLYFDLGYYDQAHFIKEFKTLYGLTPKEALGK